MRPIRNTMPPRKGKALMEKLKSRNMVEEDEDFPNDDEESLSYHLGRLEGIPTTWVIQPPFHIDQNKYVYIYIYTHIFFIPGIYKAVHMEEIFPILPLKDL